MSNSTQVVDWLKSTRQTIRDTGFQKAMREFVGDARLRFKPDAFEIHRDLKIVTLIEVVETHPITRSKAGQIYLLGSKLERCGWGTTIAVFDHCGGLVGEMPFYLFHPGLIDAFMDAAEHKDVVPAVLALQRREAAEARALQ